jgi:hypothetical protein
LVEQGERTGGRCIVADGRPNARIPRLTATRLGLMDSPGSQRRQEAAVHRTIAVCLFALTVVRWQCRRQRVTPMVAGTIWQRT